MSERIEHIVSTAEVMSISGLSRTTIWRLERTGTFPKRLQLSPARIGWRESEVAAWVAGKRDWTCADQSLSAERISA